MSITHQLHDTTTTCFNQQYDHRVDQSFLVQMIILLVEAC